MQGAALRALFVVVLLSALLAAIEACGGHDDKWSKVIEYKGRKRSLLSMHRRKCGTDHSQTEDDDKREEEFHNRQRKEAYLPGNGPNGTRLVTIPVYITVVMANDGTKIGDVSDKAINAQMKLMNDAYASNAKKFGVSWNFKVQGIKRVVGPSMCDRAGEETVKALHHKGGADALNLYFTDLSECGLLGFSSWPWQLKGGKNAVKLDGVVIHYDTLPGGKDAPYNMGRTCVHETGHWMGLYHTFQNGCARGGDLVNDTPFASSPTEGCPSYRDSCSDPGQDPIHNYLDYSDDACMHEFTPQQHQRMEGHYRQYRLAK